MFSKLQNVLVTLFMIYKMCKMAMHLHCLMRLLVSVSVRLPPSIIRQNETLTTYLGIDAKLLLVCDADGHPEPE